MHFTSPSRGTVLIVDDVAMSRKMIMQCMQHLGFTCDEASDGAEAVAMCNAKEYSLVLMDNLMPRMNGIEATVAIRRTDLLAKRSRHIFGITGDEVSDEREKFQRAGCNEVLVKPLRLDHIKQLLTAYCL